MRARGLWTRLVPVSRRILVLPQKEALIYIACREGWVECARESIDDKGVLRRQFRNRPKGNDWDPNEPLTDDETDD
jgi:hypothetical protein